MIRSPSLAVRHYSIEPRTIKYVKAYGFLPFARKTASKKLVHKTCEFLGNKIADAVTKSDDDKIVK